MQALLERVQTEVFSVTQKLDQDLKQEKKKLQQKLIARSRREMLQKVRAVLSTWPWAFPSTPEGWHCPTMGRAPRHALAAGPRDWPFRIPFR